MTNPSGQAVREGDWVTISSRHRTLYLGRAAFEPARLLRYMAGEDLGIAPEEEERFRRWAAYYREYRLILENVTAAEFESLEDLGHAIRYGELRGEDARAAEFVNRSFDAGEDRVVRRLLDTTLGSHLVNLTAFRLLTPDRQVRLMKAALAACRARGLSGYQAGAFVIGGLLRPASSTSFWPSFPPDAIAELVNEWVLHQKYVAILSDVGERHVRRAEDRILSGGMERILLDEGGVRELLPLKLSGVDLNRVRAALPEGCDPQTAEVLDLLRGVRVGRRARRRS
jgi:hypothetical protein